MSNAVGIDSAIDCTQFAQAIKQANIDFVGRYYRWPSSKLTPLTYPEAAALSGVGLSLVALWEWISDDISNFSYSNGFDQGSSAYNQALKAHQPSGTPIYFAVDSDFDPTQIAGPVNDYFSGVWDAFQGIGQGRSAYQMGVYGSGLACSWLKSHTMVGYGWLAGANWMGSNGYADWAIKQGVDDLDVQGMTSGGDGDYDSDVAQGDFGSFTVLS